MFIRSFLFIIKFGHRTIGQSYTMNIL